MLDRQFSVAQVTGPNQVWVSDLTYVPTREGWLFLAIVLDLASRRVVGWAMRETTASSGNETSFPPTTGLLDINFEVQR